MTRILKLELKGFKSFARKTEIPFGDGFNVVLGPNGSGKSNILDAICFVLGRLSSKSMRADKTGELVYSGGKSKKPAKEGMVAIEFDNSSKAYPIDAPTVKVKRVVSPKGTSAYYINEERSTRQQILELLSHARVDPEGYNIILQGDIVKFVEMSNDDRRRLIEEISGISLYEERKHKAMLELRKVDEKIGEADIVLEMRKTYLEELKKDRDQAIKFREMKSKMDSTKATIIHLDLEAHQGRKDSLEEDNTNLQEKIENLKQKIEGKRKESETIKTRHRELTKKIDESGEKKQRELFKEKEELSVVIGEQKSRIRIIKEQLERLDDRKKSISSDMEERGKKIRLVEEEISRREEEKSSAEQEIDRLAQEVKKFREKHELEDAAAIEEELAAIDKTLDEKREIVEKLREQQQRYMLEQERASVSLSSLNEQQQKVREVAKEHEEELKALKEKRQRFKSLVLELNKELTENSRLAKKSGEQQEKLLEYKDKLTRERAAQSARAEKTAASAAVKQVLQRGFEGVLGTVSSLAEVPQRYSTALEIAAGARMNNIVVQDDGVAAKCIKYLKDNKLGRVTFLPLNKIKGRPVTGETNSLLNGNGVVGLAVDLVEHRSQYKNIFEFVFGSTLVVDSLEVARRIGVGKSRMVSLEGDLVERSGAMTGGSRRKNPGTGFARKESGSVLKDMEKKVNELTMDITFLESEREKSQEKIDSMRAEKAELEGSLAAAEKRLHLDESDLEAGKEKRLALKADVEQSEKELNRVTNEISLANEAIKEVRMKREKLRQKMSALRDPKLVAELASFNSTSDELRLKSRDLNARIESYRREVKDILTPELEKAEKILKDIEKEKEAFEKEKGQLSDVIGKNEAKLKKHEEALDSFYKKHGALFKEREELQEQLERLSEAQGEVSAKLAGEEHRSNGISLKLATIKAELAALEKEYEPVKEAPLLEERSKASLKAEVTRFERLMEDMGSINLKALEIYDAVEKEYESLIEKRKKLLEEKGEVIELMESIEAKKKELFLEAFDAVSKNFHTNFKELAPKGEAWLLIENEDDPLSGGVEILAKLSEKRKLPIRSLSGGEKTMTALAFIFAIQEHEPASFYILDEVDAALDKRNSEKFAKLVAKYSQESQYVIVSHNDYVLGEADFLFGISMSGEGISKVTSLKI